MSRGEVASSVFNRAPMEWSRSETLALAQHNCAQCRGGGLRLGRKCVLEPCNCVLRAIFRICFDRFLRTSTQERFLSRVSLEPHSGRKRSGTWGRKDEEYIADFYLVAHRTLDEFERKLFRYHFLLGADWKLCARQLGIDRGNFFHAVYRIEQKLGRVFRELEPYSLYPLNEYFNGPSKFQKPEPARRESPQPLKPPMENRALRAGAG
jgi:hypothetical protein